MKKNNKGIAKNIKLNLKIAAAISPAILVLVGILGTAGVGIASVEQNTNLIEDYKATTMYTEEYTRDLKDLYDDFTDGVIDFDTFTKEVQKMDSNKYVKDVMARDIEGNEEFQPRLDTNDKLDKAFKGTVGVTFAGLAGLGVEAVVFDAQAKKRRKEQEKEEQLSEAENKEELEEKEEN